MWNLLFLPIAVGVVMLAAPIHFQITEPYAGILFWTATSVIVLSIIGRTYGAVKQRGQQTVGAYLMIAGSLTAVLGALLFISGMLLRGVPVPTLGSTVREGATSDQRDERLLGITVHTVINIQDVAALRRKYVFDLGTPDRARAAFYLSASDRFTFTVTDIHGETYPLEIPLGRRGVPFGEFTHLLCEAGSASSYSFLRVLVNGKEVQRRSLPFPIDLGSRDWRTILGADADGRNSRP
jgi:hypothetical protein